MCCERKGRETSEFRRDDAEHAYAGVDRTNLTREFGKNGREAREEEKF